MISYTITVCNEHNQLNTLLNFLDSKISDQDEIVLQMDSLSVTSEVTEVVNRYNERLKNLTVIEFPLNNDFASFKNNLKKHCTKEWIFNIDADEMPSAFLIEHIHTILKHNSELDLLIVPRWNVVDGITDDHVNVWRWNHDDLGRINWPDWQMRLYRNKEEIMWKNKVHEILDGFGMYSFLPEDKDYCLFHNKTIQKQESQNNFYNTIL